MTYTDKLTHPDGSPCAGDHCAWNGDGGHVVVHTRTFDADANLASSGTKHIDIQEALA